MKHVCGWCDTHLSGDQSTLTVSHGICADCLEFFFERGGDGLLESLLDRYPEPILVVNEDGSVLTANRPARSLLNKDAAQLRGYPGGEVMECAYARLPEGCGNTVHCKACTIRNAVEDTVRTGRGRTGVEAYQDIDAPDGTVRTMRFRISTQRTRARVLLRIDTVSPAPTL